MPRMLPFLIIAAATSTVDGWGAQFCKRDAKPPGKTPACAAKPASNFLLLSSARSGSSYVVTMLHSHPEICAGYEFFNPQWKASCEILKDQPEKERRACLDHVARAAPGAAEAILRNASGWAPPAADGLAGEANQFLLEAWWPRWDAYRFCGERRCCAWGFKWFPQTQGVPDLASAEAAAAWAAASDVKFVVLKRRDTLAVLASRWRKNVAHEASKVFLKASGNGVTLRGHSGEKARHEGFPTAELEYMRAQCRAVRAADAVTDRIVRDVPDDRKRFIYFEDIVDPRKTRRAFRELAAFVGAATIHKMSTSLLKLSDNTSTRHFANEEEVVAAIREEGCPV